MEGDLRTSGFHSFLATHVATFDASVRFLWFGGEFCLRCGGSLPEVFGNGGSMRQANGGWPMGKRGIE